MSGIERLAKLIALLPPAPISWVRRAQQLPAATVAGSTREPQYAGNAHASAIVTDEIAVERQVKTIVPRRRVVDALAAAEEAAELRLELAHSSEDLQELATISLRWTRQELTRLLERATSERIVLTFDRDQLAQAFADVETHAATTNPLTVAVTATTDPSKDEIASEAIKITAATFTPTQAQPTPPRHI